MRPKKTKKNDLDLFRSRLDQILNRKHPLFKLANQIDWSYLNRELGMTYDDKRGRPAVPTRLMVGLNYLKHTFDESDESVLDRFIENPYWQYFCGFEYFVHEFPIDPSSMTRFRKRIGDAGIEKMFKALLDTGKQMKVIKVSHLNKVNADTTVQEKAITFPTDAKLYHKMREVLVGYAERNGIKLRQSYKRLSKQALMKQQRYGHAKQYKRSGKMTKKLKTYLGCVYRDIKRKVSSVDVELESLLEIAERLLKQKRDDKNKLYSIHAPEVECISKGKVHKRYEFGCKVGMVTSSRDNWILGIKAFHGNPYDGHTLSETLDHMKEMIGLEAKEVYVDLGYRGHNYRGESKVHIVNYRNIRNMSRTLRHWFKRRASIEPTIGHLKTDNRMGRNYYRDELGDNINALLCGCGYNMRKLIAVFLLPILNWLNYVNKLKKLQYNFA